MKVSITHRGSLFIESENSMESYALKKWIEENGEEVFKFAITIDRTCELNPNNQNEKNL